MRLSNPHEVGRPPVGGQAPGSSGPPPVSRAVNGERRHLVLDPRVTLLDALREHLHLTGTKNGCDHGHCGACTVLVTGIRINACLSLAAMHDGDEATIEGSGRPDRLHPLQAAFLAHDAFQCGYCTPGQICSAVGVLAEAAAGGPSHVDIPHLDVVFLDHSDPVSSPMKAKVIGEIGLCGAASAVANAVTNATGIRVRDDPITLDKLLDRLPRAA